MSENNTYGILVDYEWCTGCHSCEMACQMEHKFPIGQGGIKVSKVGPYQIEGDNWVYDHNVTFTKQCDLCGKRTANGKLPACVHHCQAKCMTYGKADELLAKAGSGERQALFVF